MNPITNCFLYGILDLGYVAPEQAEWTSRAMVAGGVDVLQLRAKRLDAQGVAELANRIHPISAEQGVPLVINDHPEVAAEVRAEGCHVGQDDISVAEARRLSGRTCIVGKSTHSLAQAVAAQAEGADYIGFGPLFATPTKPDYAPIGTGEVLSVHDLVSVPIFCIGGIKLENLAEVVAAGARRVVIVSGILNAEDIAAYCRLAKRGLMRP